MYHRAAELLKRPILATYLLSVRQTRAGHRHTRLYPLCRQGRDCLTNEISCFSMSGIIKVKLWMKMKMEIYHVLTAQQAIQWLEAGHQEQTLGKVEVLRRAYKSLHDPLPFSFFGLIPAPISLASFNYSFIGSLHCPLHSPDTPHLRVSTPISSAPSLSWLLLYFLQNFIPSHFFDHPT